MLSLEMYVDASLVKANVSGYGLQPSGMTVAEFKEQAIEENGLFVLTTTAVDDDDVEQENVRYFQSPGRPVAAEPSGHRCSLGDHQSTPGVGIAVPGERHR